MKVLRLKGFEYDTGTGNVLKGADAVVATGKDSGISITIADDGTLTLRPTGSGELHVSTSGEEIDSLTVSLIN